MVLDEEEREPEEREDVRLDLLVKRLDLESSEEIEWAKTVKYC